MKVLISGSTGLVGSHLVSVLRGEGHEAVRLMRPSSRLPSGEPAIAWDPRSGKIEARDLEGLDAIVHLAGESIATGRWNQEKKQRIRRSRVEGTRILSQAIVSLENPPPVFVQSSAIGYYGDRGEEVLTEESEAGSGFLADVCREWEAASDPVQEKGVRVVRLRIGLVLSATGGALAKMLGPFRLGLGGPVAGGKQYVSWIRNDELSRVILRALTDEKLSGAVNAVSPNPVHQREFARTLGKVLSRPAILPLPAFAVKLQFGEMGEELLMASTRVRPAVLEQAGFEFRNPDLEEALRALLAS